MRPLRIASACSAPFVQIAVLTLAGSTIDTDRPQGCELDPEHVRERLERVLRSRIRTKERQCAAPSDGAHENDASAAAAKRGEKRLQHGDLADDVDLELPTELIEGYELERSRNCDPSVVDQPLQLRPGGIHSRRDLLGVGDVELERLDAAFAQFGGGFLRPDATEDAPPGSREPERRGEADARRRPGDDDRATHAQSASPLPRSSWTACSDFSRSPSSMPWSTRGAFVNWTSR